MSWQLSPEDVAQLEHCIGSPIKDVGLFSRAFLHNTYINENPSLDLRMQGVPIETIGRAVIDFLFWEELFLRNPVVDNKQVNLAWQALIKSVPVLAEKSWGAMQFWRHGKGQIVPVPGDVAVSVIGALYLTSGCATVQRILKPLVGEAMGAYIQGEGFVSYKTMLLEYAQAKGGQTPVYRDVDSYGPSHAATFEVEVNALGHRVVGKGRSKRQAGEEAAQEFFERHVPGYRLLIESSVWGDSKASQRVIAPIPPSRREELLNVAGLVGLNPERLYLLDMALTHSTFANEHPGAVSNQRLVGLGARALLLISLHNFWSQNVEIDPELLNLNRQRVVSVESREQVFNTLTLSRVFRVAGIKGELPALIKAEAVYALIGAIVLSHYGTSQPLQHALEFFVRYFSADLLLVRDSLVDPVTLLQEWAQTFGCRIEVGQSRATGSSSERLHRVPVVLIDEASGRPTRLRWEGTASSIQKASKAAAQTALVYLRENLNLSRTPSTDSACGTVTKRLVKKLFAVGQGQSELRILELLGGFGVEAFRNGDYEVALTDFGRVLKNIEAMGLPTDEIVRIYRRLVSQPPLLKQEAIIEAFVELRTWLERLTPATTGNEVAQHLNTVLDILQVARGVASSKRPQSVSLQYLIERTTPLVSRSVKVLSRVASDVVVFAHEDIMYAILYRVLTAFRETQDVPEVLVEYQRKVGGATRTVDLAFTSDHGVGASELIPRLEVVIGLCQLQLAKLRLLHNGLILTFEQPRWVSDVGGPGVFWRLVQENLTSLGRLGTVAPIVHDLKNEFLVLRQRLAKSQSTELDIPFLELRNTLVRVTESIIHYLQSAARPLIRVVSMHDFTAAVGRQIRSLIPDNRTQLRVRSAFDMDYVYSDETFLHSIVLNLAKNSIEAMPYGGEVDVTIEVKGKAELHICVRDTGIGIPPDQLPTILTEARTSKREAGGTGLGLLTVKRFVGALGGTMSIDSELNVGTNIAVRVPVEPAQPQ